MPNAIMGLKYLAPAVGERSEAGLLHILKDLKDTYEILREEGFEFFKKDGAPFDNFHEVVTYVEEFCQFESLDILLKGSGDIGGLAVKNATVMYDLLEVSESIRYWDQGIGDNCGSCIQRYRAKGDNQCGNDVSPMHWDSACESHDAKIKGPDGKSARKLQEILEEACK